MLVLSTTDVASLLDLDALVHAVEAAMIDASAGRASMPPRVAATVPEREALLAAMPAYLPSVKALTTKLVSLFPQNTDRPTHQALICCFDAATGTPIAIMDGTHVTATRTAAGSALASRLLARRDARVVAILGAGVQARAHARALARRAGIERLVIAARSPDRAQALVDELAAEGIDADTAASVEDAVRGADIVCATTHADTPVVRREWLRPGTHVNSVGYNSAGEGEVDAATIRDALVVVETRAAALAPPPSGAVELRRAIEAGIVDAGHVAAELGELAVGRATGRTSDEQITLYKSVGVAVQDAAAAAMILDAARRSGAGTTIAM